MFKSNEYWDYLCKYTEEELGEIKSIYQADIYSDKISLPFSVWKFDRKLDDMLTNATVLIGPEIVDKFTEKYGESVLNVYEYGYLMKKTLDYMTKSHAVVKNGDVKEPFYVYAIRTLGKDFRPFLDSITETRCKYIDANGDILAQIMLKSDLRANSIALDAIKKYPEGVYHVNKRGEMLINTALRAFREKDGDEGYRFANKVNKITPIVRVNTQGASKTAGK